MKRNQRMPSPDRRASVLLVILVIIVLLSLAAYTFVEMCVAENQATSMFGRTVQARAFAESGIDLAITVLSDPAERAQPDFVTNRRDVMAAVIMHPSDVARGRGRFSIVAPDPTDPTSKAVRYGLMDESGKLNLNYVVTLGLDDTTARNLLMNLPYMTNDLADSILDWIDSDETARQYGSENEYYTTLNPPYRAANSPLVSLDDLLLVRGVTPSLLYGEDLNRNGVMDPGEDINGDGYFDRGWSAYFTVTSAERNVQQDGSPRININAQDLPTLYDSLAGAVGDKGAQFIVAYRLYGPSTTTTTNSNSTNSGSTRGGRSGSSSSTSSSSSSGVTMNSSSSSQGASKSSSSSGGGSGGSGGGSSSSSSGSGSSGGGSGGSSRSGGGRGGGGGRNSGQTVSRGGLQLPMPPATGTATFKSIYQLIGASVKGSVNGTNTTLQSPWASGQAQVAENMPNLLDKLSLVDDLFIKGRINVNTATLPVLLGLPGMTEQLATQIVAAQTASSTSGSATQNPRATNAWLVAEGLTTVATMQQLDPYLTARGDVYRVQSVGFFDEGGPVVRMEAIIDSAVQPARILSVRDLSELGRGFTRQQLGVP